MVFLKVFLAWVCPIPHRDGREGFSLNIPGALRPTFHIPSALQLWAPSSSHPQGVTPKLLLGEVRDSNPKKPLSCKEIRN